MLSILGSANGSLIQKLVIRFHLVAFQRIPCIQVIQDQLVDNGNTALMEEHLQA